MSAICFQPAWRQMEALNSGQITSVDLLEHHIAHFQRVNRKVNAVIKTDIERARERANAMDGLREKGNILGPLHGLPMTIKDVLDVDSMPATAGAPQFADRQRPVPDANVVDLAKRAGAVIWGKTNVPYLANDWQTGNKLFGASNNPYDLSRTPGGSSGGAAAALAAGLSPLEIGSDIGGSLRIPAHFCGVCSLKPTYGVVSQTGHVPPSPEYSGQVDLNVVGPMARSIRDLKLLRSVIQPGATNRPTVNALHLRGRKIAVWADSENWPVETEITELIATAVQEIEDVGAEIRYAKPDIDPHELIDVYLSLLVPITTMELPVGGKRLASMMRPFSAFLNLFQSSPFNRYNWILKGTLSHADWILADGRRAAFKSIMRDFFSTYDALIMPVSPTHAFKHQPPGPALSRKLKVDGKLVPYGVHMNWIALATACHLPAVTLPIGHSNDGMPIGLQIVGAQGDDARILDIAEACEGVFGGFRKPANNLA